MANNGQDFFDYLTNELERHFDEAGVFVKETWRSQTWLPDYARPAPPPAPRYRPRFSPPLGFYGSIKRWLAEHVVLTAATVAFFGTSGLLLYQRRKLYLRKRRATKRADGTRKECVVVAGVPNSPVTRTVVLDLERRGFIVYVVASSAHEEQLIQDERKSDIRPLHLNVTDPVDVQSTMHDFSQNFPSSYSEDGSVSNNFCSFAGLILIPDLMYPAGPIETISNELWYDSLNAKVLSTIATAQAFLRVVCEHKSRILILTPTIIHSLKPAFHGVESTVVGALEGFTSSLQSELATVGAKVCHIKMGTFDCSNVGERQSLKRSTRADILSWPSFARDTYGQNYSLQSEEMTRSRILSSSESGRKGSSLRELNNAVFDTLTARRPWSVQRVGQGSLIYGMIGAVAPAQLVSWMVGVKTIGSRPSAKRRESDSQWERLEKST